MTVFYEGLKKMTSISPDLFPHPEYPRQEGGDRDQGPHSDSGVLRGS